MDVKYYRRESLDLALLLAFWAILGVHYPLPWEMYFIHLFALPVLQVSVFNFLGIYRINWQYHNLFHFASVLGVNLLLIAVYFISASNFQLHALNLSSFYSFAGALLSMNFIMFAHRIYWYFRLNPENMRKKTGDRSVIIYGAGTVTMNLLHDLGTDDLIGRYHISTIVDNNPVKIGSRLGPYKVHSAAELPHLVKKYRAKELWLTMPVDPMFMREILEQLNEYSITYKVVPRKFSHILPDIRTLRVEDLVKRPEIKLSYDPLIDIFKGKRVLITGAAGSIGSEIVSQLLTFDIKRAVLVDQDEYGIYQLGRTYANDKRVVCIINDIRNEERTLSLIKSEKPEFIFHAAAYKHVPLMETHYIEAVLTNVIGTYNLLQSARALVKSQPDDFNLKFVNISTDKAVSPQNVMGLTKRISELLVYNLASPAGKNSKAGGLSSVSVRFGNVLSSSGSVVPLFWEQIQRGGPLTVTHPDMERFFMTIPEAVNLVLHSILESTGDDILALDMGKPVKIVELAKRLILISGHTPHKDIKIEFTGKRPGEKLKEELFWTKNSLQTKNKYIFRSRTDLRKIEPGAVIEKIQKALNKEYSLHWWKKFLKQFI